MMNLRNRLKDFTYSFSSLTKILACPFLFYHQYILGMEPPAFMDDDEKINMQMGSFVHKFLQQLSTGPERNWLMTGRSFLMNSGKVMKTPM